VFLLSAPRERILRRVAQLALHVLLEPTQGQACHHVHSAQKDIKRILLNQAALNVQRTHILPLISRHRALRAPPAIVVQMEP